MFLALSTCLYGPVYTKSLKRLFLKTPAKVEISENATYVLLCELGETAF